MVDMKDNFLVVEMNVYEIIYIYIHTHMWLIYIGGFRLKMPFILKC